MRSTRTFTWRNWLQRTFGHTSAESRVPARKRRIRSRWLRPSLERLEDRTLLNGRAVAFFVAGYDGGSFPPDTMSHLNDLFHAAQQSGTIKSYDIYLDNWNSPNPISDDAYSSNAQNITDPNHNGIARTGKPGKLMDDITAGAFDALFGFGLSIPTDIAVSQNPEGPDPSLPNQFINNLTSILNTKYDNNDFIVLVGHSFGGNSVLRVAQDTDRKISFLATLDPVGWSKTGVLTTNNVQIVPELDYNVPSLLQPFLGDTYKLPGTPIGFPVPTGAIAQYLSLNPNMIDSQRGLPGYRNELLAESPGPNVQYFYNRWQEDSPFPFDYSDSGALNDSLVQHSVDSINYDGKRINDQEQVTDFRDAAGNPEAPSQNPETSSGLDKVLNFLWGHEHLDVTYPTVSFGSLAHPKITVNPGSISFPESTSMTHGDLPHDTYIQDQMNAIFDALVPMPPTVTATAPATVHEGDTVTLSGSATSNDPNASFQYSWKEIAGPADVTPFSPMFNPNVANPTFVVPETGNYTFQLTVTNTDTGLSGIGDATFFAVNVPPTAGPITGPTQVIRNFPNTYSITFTDPGLIDSHSVSWNFNDGPSTTQPSESPAIIQHTYATEGNYTILAIVNDQDGGQSAIVSYAVTVKAAGLVTNPSTGKQDLIVSGTPNDDSTILTAGPTPGSVVVIEDGNSEGTFTPTGAIKVVGFGGSDTLTIDFSNRNMIPAGGLIFDPGNDPNANSKLILRNGSFTNEVYTPSGPGSGIITFDDGGPVLAKITFSNLRPIDDTVSVTTDTINGTAPTQSINIIDHSGLINGLRATEVNSGNTPTFELVNFAQKRNVIVNSVGGSDTLTLDNPKPAAGLASLTINGSNAGNTFNVQALAVPTTINTGSGVNILNLYDANNSMAEITALLTINGQGGNNTLNAANDTNFTLTDSSLSSGTVNVVFNSVQIANLMGGSGGNTFDVSGWSGSGSLDGQGGNNVVSAENDGDFTLTDSSLGRTNRGTLRLENIQTAQLTGGPGANDFLVLNWSGLALLDGKGGNNTYDYTVGNGGTVHILDTAKTGTDSAVVTGTNSGDTFNITSSQLTEGLDTVTYDKNLDKLSVNGGSVSDVFNVTPSVATTFVLDGGAPPPPTSPGDTLNLDLKGSTGAFRTATPTASGYQGSWTFANRHPVNFTHMETLTPALHLSGAGTPINGFEYSALNGTLAAKFTNADFLVPASDFVASIDWGDGTVTAGTITLSGTTYLIRGSHTYTDESTYTVKVTVSGDLTAAHFTTSATMLEQLLPDGTRGTPNQRFISELFRDLLQRPVDQGSLNFWNNLLNLGLPQSFVVLGIESTPEYRQLQVKSLYQRYLHRQPNSFELTMATDFLLAGATPEQLAMYLVSTPEFFFQQGGGSLTGYLSAYYQDALQSRALADVEMADMMQMAQGASLSDIVQEVLHQPDYQQGVVNDLVLSLLDRNPTGTETSNLSLALEMGLTDDDVLALLATTTPYQEYFNKTAS